MHRPRVQNVVSEAPSPPAFSRSIAPSLPSPLSPSSYSTVSWHLVSSHIRLLNHALEQESCVHFEYHYEWLCKLLTPLQSVRILLDNYPRIPNAWQVVLSRTGDFVQPPSPAYPRFPFSLPSPFVRAYCFAAGVAAKEGSLPVSVMSIAGPAVNVDAGASRAIECSGGGS